MNLLWKIKDFTKSHTAFSLSVLNACLLIVSFFLYDPLHLFTYTYNDSDPILDFSENEIEEIRIENSDKNEIAIQRKDNSWIVTNIQKETAQGDSEKIQSLIDALFEARKYTSLGTNKAQSFGLDQDGIQIRILRKGNPAQGIQIGKVTPRGESTYVMDLSDKRIYLVEGNLRTAAGRGKSEFFLEKSLVASQFHWEDLVRVDIVSPKAEFHFQKTGGNWYWEKENNPVRLDSQQFTRRMETLLDIEANSIEFDLKSWNRIPIPSTKIELSFQKESKLPHRIDWNASWQSGNSLLWESSEEPGLGFLFPNRLLEDISGLDPETYLSEESTKDH